MQAPDPTANLTFNLTLSEKERRERAKVVLPYTYTSERKSAHLQVRLCFVSSGLINNTFLSHCQVGSGKIFYQPDDADDFDESDPDDDLDIWFNCNLCTMISVLAQSLNWIITADTKHKCNWLQHLNHCMTYIMPIIFKTSIIIQSHKLMVGPKAYISIAHRALYVHVYACMQNLWSILFSLGLLIGSTWKHNCRRCYWS